MAQTAEVQLHRSAPDAGSSQDRRESLTHDESDRAVRIARITSLSEEVFGDDAKATR
jgi:uncharacterized protein (DUF2384 family)